MWRKTLISILMILSFSSIAFGGEVVELACDTCGFKSGDLYSGGGMAGGINTIVYCEQCKSFFAVPTSVTNETVKNVLSIVEPKGKKEFLGKERLVYPCPKCGAEAVNYDDALNREVEKQICPICLKGKLNVEITGKWD